MFHVILDASGNFQLVQHRRNVGPDERIIRSYASYGLAESCLGVLAA